MLEVLRAIFSLPKPVSKQIDSSGSANFYRRMIWTARCLAAIGILAGVLMWIAVASEAAKENGGAEFRSGKQVVLVIFAPVLFAMVGYLGGLILLLPIAPTSFFQGSLGEQFLAFVGVKRIFSARIVCLLLASIYWGVPSLLAGIIVRKSYNEEWTRPGGWLYREPPKSQIATGPTVTPVIEPPDPLEEAKYFIGNVRHEVQNEDFRDITITQDSALRSVYDRLEEQRKLWSESPEALAELNALEKELSEDSWLKAGKSLLDNREALQAMMDQAPKLNSAKMAQLAEAQPDEPTMSLKNTPPQSTLVLVWTRDGLKFNPAWNKLIGDHRADSFETMEKLIVIRSDRQVLGLYKSDNQMAKMMLPALERELEEHPDGNFQNQGLRQWLFRLGAFRWMHQVSMIDTKNADKNESWVVFVDDASSQTVSSTEGMPGMVAHKIDEAEAKTRQFISSLAGYNPL